MVDGGIPHEVVWLSILIIVYSFICLIASLLMITSLLILGERFQYITLISIAATVGTIASIIQQVHYAVAWVDIKEGQFSKALLSLTNPGLSFGGPSQIWDVVLFNIQYYTYNLEGLLTLFWAGALFKSTWNFQMKWFSQWERRLEISSKIFAVVFPAILIGSINTPEVKHHPTLLFILGNCILLTTPVLGSILLLLILFKYIKSRLRTATPGRKYSWWSLLSIRSFTSSSSSSKTLLATSIGFQRRDSEPLYNLSLVVRFSVGFLFLIGFEVAILIYNLRQISKTAELAASPSSGPDFSAAHAFSDLLVFVPGVTASLTTFLVFGTTKRTLLICKSILMCRFPCHAIKENSRKRPVIRHRGTTATVEAEINEPRRADCTRSRIVNNFSRPVALQLITLDTSDKTVRFNHFCSGSTPSSGSNEGQRTTFETEPDLNKPLPYMPTSKSVMIGLVVRKGAWEEQNEAELESRPPFSKSQLLK